MNEGRKEQEWEDDKQKLVDSPKNRNWNNIMTLEYIPT